MPEQHHQTSEESQEQSQSDRKRIRYTPELKLKLIQLCIENGDHYIETTPEDDFWSYIRTLFISFTECIVGNGSTIRRKVVDIVSERKATIAVRRVQSGVAVAPPTDLEQVTDTWIEWMDRRGEEKQAKNTQSTQIKQEKEKAAIKRLNLTKTLSEKRTFQEVAMVNLTDSNSVRDKRRKTGQAWASSKDKEMQEHWDRMDRRDEETLGLIRDILNTISSPTISTPPTNNSPANIPSASHASSSHASSSHASSSHASSSHASSSHASSSHASSSHASSSHASSSHASSSHASSSTAPPINSPSDNSFQSSSSTEGRVATLEAEISEIRGTQLEILHILSEMRKG
ncbi:hypothetical protein BGX38DRAFT_1265407 [Terfezia claveryi]|nr:hypothetical protein BGX38DRAFT_1265407 [Terfezia claveryi]